MIILFYDMVCFKLKVTQEVCQILQTTNYPLTCRGTVNVKGKGEMVTYFLDGYGDRVPVKASNLANAGKA